MDSLTLRLGDLLENPKYSDLEIVCDGYVFQVHRNIVCLRSEVLAKECDGKYKEAESCRIEHGVFDRFAVDRMLQFMYRGDYRLYDSVRGRILGKSSTPGDQADGHTESETPSPEEPLVSHVHVYAIADYYQMPELQELALKKFADARTTRGTLNAEQLIHIAANLYANTTKQAVKLRQELLTLAYESPNSSVDNPIFMGAIGERRDLQEFGADFLAQWVKKHRAETQRLAETTAIVRSLGDTLVASIRHNEEAQQKLQIFDKLSQVKACDHCKIGQPIGYGAFFNYTLVKAGQDEYGLKCLSCANVTRRRRP
ncbi:BTB POZ domain [Lecanosticta acicola]|uniref:BTB POZ domain n=1 Tax=Lecanosticta acicola TaxID=111012 RepID=A0AAI8Z755_9PEZI|nr:BTB POZ domain [Lecanosticta acicola]